MVTKHQSPSAVGNKAMPKAQAQPKGCTNLKVRQLSRLVTRDYDARVGDHGMKTSQYSLLSHVIRLAPVRPSDLAADMRLDASTLTRNLQSLVAQGWVEMTPGPDARSRLIVATPAGRLKRDQTCGAWKVAQVELNDRLGAERVARLHALIDECLELLEAERIEPEPAG
jgi:DNA-binding MarR family transcriptional regulator